MGGLNAAHPLCQDLVLLLCETAEFGKQWILIRFPANA